MWLKRQPGPFRIQIDAKEIPYNYGDWNGLELAAQAVVAGAGAASGTFARLTPVRDCRRLVSAPAGQTPGYRF